MKKPEIENLKALLKGNNLSLYQNSDAVSEFKHLQNYVKHLEEQLRLCAVLKPLKEKEAQTFKVDLNTKQAENYRCEQMEKILSVPCKAYIYKDGKYIPL